MLMPFLPTLSTQPSGAGCNEPIRRLTANLMLILREKMRVSAMSGPLAGAAAPYFWLTPARDWCFGQHMKCRRMRRRQNWITPPVALQTN
jgi:hypothetical protein